MWFYIYITIHSFVKESYKKYFLKPDAAWYQRNCCREANKQTNKQT